MESDPATRRREAVIAGHLGDEQLAWTALADPDPKTRASAIGALNRMGMIGAKELEPLLKDPSSEVRKRACQIAPRLPRDASRKGDRPKVASILRDTLSDEDPLVAEMACWALGELKDRRAVNPLMTLIRDHPDSRCREAAVAALGAIGDQRGLEGVLAGLEDKATVRRRAVVALAAFRGPESEEAIRKCLEDRDWQVRDAAKILLDV